MRKVLDKNDVIASLGIYLSCEDRNYLRYFDAFSKLCHGEQFGERGRETLKESKRERQKDGRKTERWKRDREIEERRKDRRITAR